ncbi:double-stranded RNA-binding protein 4 isoform X3 [Tripterygium wilfordii]|uniref:Double-stranded RNA-binding protein 4 isoform X3 n=1 Tax=Tripterygium wilfordii TaxID=458696 RepID=A0A7J7CY26_TRIWF|nr:uncharacterized protein LOC120010762 [Tripterygium wilfordii]KAF5739002.1 double-stranded RNA-binding protein 4 isoform X3 [Tripterygium wilfordii]
MGQNLHFIFFTHSLTGALFRSCRFHPHKHKTWTSFMADSSQVYVPFIPGALPLHKLKPWTSLMVDSSQVYAPFKAEDLNSTMPQPELPDAEDRAPTHDPVVQTESVPGHPAPALGLAPVPASASSSPADTPQKMMHKNRLQEYTQRASLPLPTYQTVNLGSQHAPNFRSTVLVDGATYSSPNTFPHRKTAEQDAARVALECLPEKIKYEGPPIICEETTFCKSILNEYAVKMNFDIPAYNTVQSEGSLPCFTSSLVFNAVFYTGKAGKNKKEAEQLAARAVILSLLGDNRTGTILYEIIKSKDKLYAALHKGKNFQTHHNSPLDGGSAGPHYGMPLTQGREVEAFVVPGASSEANQPHHYYKKQKLGPPFVPNHLPITFVAPVSAQPQGDGPSCAKKGKKNKKKAKKKLQTGDELSLAVFPPSQDPPCSVAQ